MGSGIIDAVKNIAGMGKKPKAPKIQPAQRAGSSAAEQAADIVQQNEDERRRRLLALNSGGSRGQLTGAGGDTSAAPVTRKTLFGQ